MSTISLTPAEILDMQRHAIEAYPSEACGVILERAGDRRPMRCRNVQDELHARDPRRFPRDARTAYYMAPQNLLRIAELQRDGFRLAVIYHSHVNGAAVFSETDRRQALVDGQPAYPDTEQVVIAVRPGFVAEVVGFRWDAQRRDFLPRWSTP